MKQYIKLIRHAYEEPYHLNLFIECSNGRLSGKLEYYCNASDLTDISNNLSDFLQNTKDEYIYELGSENPKDNFAHYLKFRFYKIGAFGKIGIQIRLNNNDECPDDEQSEFSILTDITGIDRFIEALTLFSQLSTQSMFWKEDK